MYKIEKAINGKKIILFGIGKQRDIVEVGEDLKTNSICFMFDEFGDKIGYIIDNYNNGTYSYKSYQLNVYPVKKLKDENPNDFFVIIMADNKIYREEMRIQLEGKGLKYGKNYDYIWNYNDDIEKYTTLIIKKRTMLVNDMIDEMKSWMIPIEEYGVDKKNEVEKYWTEHTVYSKYFLSKEDSIEYCNTRFKMYPYFKELAEMEKCHDGEIVLDYGCGPGNDLVWYTHNNNVKQIIGVDVSITSLKKAQFRLALQGVTSDHARLIHINDAEVKVPLHSNSVDFINCQGVLMHTFYPEEILKEFYRVLKKEQIGRLVASIMVYNRDSIWYHLYVAYYLRFVDSGIFDDLPKELRNNMDLNEMFRRSTDGIMCTKSDCYKSVDFIDMCINAGFSKCIYKGGYPNSIEPDIAHKYLQVALNDDRLEDEHKKFLSKITFDEEGYPIYEGKFGCIGGVYLLYI